MDRKTESKNKVRRPTEDRAFSFITREAAKLGITQFELVTRTMKATGRSRVVHCQCLYCKRKREKDLTYKVRLNFEPTAA